MLRDAELKYNILEKQVYALVKALKALRTYVLQSQIIAYVPNIAVKDVLVQSDVEGKRGKWIAKIQEYDLDIKPTKLVKGQGLAKMLTESNFQALGINLLTLEKEEISKGNEEKSNPGMKIRYIFLCSEWYKHIVHCLCFLSCPQSLDRTTYRALRIKAQPYVIVEGRLYWKDPVGILLLCLTEDESTKMIKDYHERLCGGHYSWKVTQNSPGRLLLAYLIW